MRSLLVWVCARSKNVPSDNCMARLRQIHAIMFRLFSNPVRRAILCVSGFYHFRPQNCGQEIYGHSADCKRGRRKGAMSKNCQKVSKSFSTLFVIFRAGQKTSKIVKKCQKYLRHFSTVFARHQFSGPFWGTLRHEDFFRFIVEKFCCHCAGS